MSMLTSQAPLLRVVQFYDVNENNESFDYSYSLQYFDALTSGWHDVPVVRFWKPLPVCKTVPTLAETLSNVS